MKSTIRLTSILFISAFLVSAEVSAQTEGFGLGIILGEPTGISAKNWLSEKTAIDFALAWSFEGKDSITLHGDMVSHKYDTFKIKEGKLPFYYGIGFRIRFGDDKSRLGVRIPLGLNYHFKDVTLDLFFEIVPVLELAPNTELELDGAIGVRYFFTR